MRLQVHGCAGGIGGREKLTTCLRLDDDILLDAGTGASDMTLEELTAIDHVFLTHAHLDHVSGLAFMLDSVMGKRNSGPIVVHATPKVIDTLKTHVFNWLVWPDFTQIPDADHPLFVWAPMEKGATVNLNGRLITSYPVRHTVDAVAYWVRGEKDGFVFSGDMASTPQLWADIKDEKLISAVIVDCSFPDEEAEVAQLSKHFCPSSLMADIKDMPASVRFLISHLKPGQEELIMSQLQTNGAHRSFTALGHGDVLVF